MINSFSWSSTMRPVDLWVSNRIAISFLIQSPSSQAQHRTATSERLSWDIFCLLRGPKVGEGLLKRHVAFGKRLIKAALAYGWFFRAKESFYEAKWLTLLVKLSLVPDHLIIFLWQSRAVMSLLPMSYCSLAASSYLNFHTRKHGHGRRFGYGYRIHGHKWYEKTYNYKYIYFYY